MSKKKELIPELRFPEFKNEGEWAEKMLVEIAQINPASFHLPNKFAYIDLESVENGVLLRKKIIRTGHHCYTVGVTKGLLKGN